MSSGDTVASACGDSANNSLPVMDKELNKKLKIKTGVCKRLHKEVGYYEKEATKLLEKVEKMKEDGKSDEYDIRKQAEVAQESSAMIPDAKRRLKVALEDLRNEITNCNDTSGLSSEELEKIEDYKAAKSILEEASQVV